MPTRARFADRFLTEPGRTALLGSLGEATTEFSSEIDTGPVIDLAGVRCEVRGLDDNQVAELEAELPDHLDRQGAADGSGNGWRLDVRHEPGEWFRAAREAASGEYFWDYFLDLDPQASAIRCAGVDFFARLERGPARRLDVRLRRGLRGAALGQPMLNLLRIVTAFGVAESGGLLLHSSALVRDSVAVVCPGRSGAGKSTLSGRARDLGWQVLSDELNVLWVPESDSPHPQPRVQQVPFTGDLGRLEVREGSYPVAAVLPVVRTGRDERPPLSAAAFFASVLSEAVFANCDPVTLPQLEATTARLVRWATEQGRVESLSFTPTGDLDGLSDLLEAVRRAA